MELLTSLAVPIQKDWVGSGIAGEARRSYELRQALIRAQRVALDELGGNYPARLKVSWRIRLADQSEWEWNPQMGVPVEATYLVFVVAGE